MPRLSRRSALAAAALLLAASSGAWAAPAPPPADMSLGRPTARVQVVEYASLTCPHCAHFNIEVFPAFKAKYVDTGKVRYTLREILTEPAQVAAAGFLMARCAGPKKYFTVVDQLFRSQAQWTSDNLLPTFRKIAADNGLSDAQFDACLRDEAAAKALNERVQTSVRDGGIDGTPTFVINGKKMPQGAMTLEQLDVAIAAAAKGGR
ncbi:MAG: DsbA family protein [Phenylobacterium sp.]